MPAGALPLDHSMTWLPSLQKPAQAALPFSFPLPKKRIKAATTRSIVDYYHIQHDVLLLRCYCSALRIQRSTQYNLHGASSPSASCNILFTIHDSHRIFATVNVPLAGSQGITVYLFQDNTIQEFRTQAVPYNLSSFDT